MTNPTSVNCPNCQAKPGQPCTQPTDTGRKAVTWFHMARVDLAQFDSERRNATPVANTRRPPRER